MLEHHAYAEPGDSVRRPARDLDAIDAHRPAIGPLDAEYRFHHCRLARPVRPDQTENFASLHGEADVLHGGESAESLVERLDLEKGARAHVASLTPLTMPSSPPGKTSTTASAIAETMKVARSPSGRSASPMAIKNTAPSTAPRIVRRPPSTAPMITCTPTVTSMKVPTEAVPR